MTTEPGWVVDPRPTPEALTDTFKAEPFTDKVSHEHEHIDSWNSFGNILGPDGVKALMKAVR